MILRINQTIVACFSAAVAFSTACFPACADESPMPAKYAEKISPELSARYTYTEDGPYTKALNIPTYQWMPSDAPPRAVILAIHGLTLHGRRYRVLARALASHGIGFIALDMRGFGRCRFDDKKQFSTKDDDRSKVDHEKSYEDIVALAKLIRADYPNIRMIDLGESLGCTFCIKLAAEHPELADGVVLSAPAVKVNKDMYAGKGQIRQGVRALVRPGSGLNIDGFFTELCSSNKEIQEELKDDPLVLKNLTLRALISTDEFVDKTAKWGKSTSPKLVVLILQGSADGCVSPKHVTELMNNMPSTDQTLAWRGNFGHLQLETSFMRAESVDAIANWLMDHSVEAKMKQKQLQEDISGLGGTFLN